MGKRILVVDDDEHVLKLEEAILTRPGYEVVLARGGREALGLLSERAFDLVILDVMMPDMDGFAVCREIRADPKLKGTPVIFLTAKGGGGALAAGLEAGGVMYVNKPFTATRLLTIVDAMLEAQPSS